MHNFGKKCVFFKKNYSVGETLKAMKTRSVKGAVSGRILNRAHPCRKWEM
jgi:hypothetical protein